MFAEFVLGHILSDESEAKVKLITQINTAYRVWKHRCITTSEFDFLYDQDEETLVRLLSDTQAVEQFTNGPRW